MSASLEFRAVDLRYGRNAALHGVELTVRAGETVGLIGPNGAGKTSIAKLATGFTLPTRGTVEVCGMAARLYRRRHGVGYAPEDLPRPWSCRVRQLLAMRAADGHAGTASFDQAVLDTLGIGPLLERPIHTLSKGQWRAVLIAWAMLTCPALVVLDEPDSGLDPGALDRLVALLELARGAGMTVLVLSHQLFEVERTCGRVLFVNQGEIVAEEKPGAGGDFLRQRYREVFA